MTWLVSTELRTSTIVSAAKHNSNLLVLGLLDVLMVSLSAFFTEVLVPPRTIAEARSPCQSGRPAFNSWPSTAQHPPKHIVGEVRRLVPGVGRAFNEACRITREGST